MRDDNAMLKSAKYDGLVKFPYNWDTKRILRKVGAKHCPFLGDTGWQKGCISRTFYPSSMQAFHSLVGLLQDVCQRQLNSSLQDVYIAPAQLVNKAQHISFAFHPRAARLGDPEGCFLVKVGRPRMMFLLFLFLSYGFILLP